MKYSTVSFASTSRRRTTDPIETTLVSTSFVSMTRASVRRSSSCAIRCSSIICSFFASSYSAFSAISPNSRARCDALGDLAPLLGAQPVELRLQLLVALGSEDHILHENASRDGIAGPPAPSTAEW